MDSLTFHVINSGIGESIVIETPRGEWGVVDCYTPSLADSTANPTIQFLRQCGVKCLAFVCITHPHEDHYRGLNQLLDAFPLKYFWRFGAFSGRDLKLILLSYVLRDAEGDELASATELTKAFGTIRRRLQTGEIEAVVKLNDYKPVYPYPIGSDPNFEISGIAPSSNDAQAYEEALARCFDATGRLENALPRQRHNDVSVALLLRYGATRVILGGDVEVRGWTETLRTVGKENLRVHAVKVSHHGSITGYTPELWTDFAAAGKPVAVVTPYRRFNLPHAAALKHIGDHCSALLTTCRQAMSLDRQFDFWEEPAFDVSMLIKSRFRSWRAARLDEGIGMCSVSFDDRGNCTYDFVGAAGRVVI